ncbi:MAG: CopG family transcriptional regulator [Nanoarchaeota archaeon]
MEHISNKKGKSTRVGLSFNDQQIMLIDSLIGEMGDKRADVVKSIFLCWLSEKNIASDLIKKRLKENGKN